MRMRKYTGPLPCTNAGLAVRNSLGKISVTARTAAGHTVLDIVPSSALSRCTCIRYQYEQTLCTPVCCQLLCITRRLNVHTSYAQPNLAYTSTASWHQGHGRQVALQGMESHTVTASVNVWAGCWSKDMSEGPWRRGAKPLYLPLSSSDIYRGLALATGESRLYCTCARLWHACIKRAQAAACGRPACGKRPFSKRSQAPSKRPQAGRKISDGLRVFVVGLGLKPFALGFKP